MSGVPERTWSLVVAPINAAPAKIGPPSPGRDLSNLDIEFKIKKTLKPKPNTADIKLWGLGSDTRQYLESADRLSVTLQAGYNGDNETLYIGETRHAYSKIIEKAGEIETYLETGTALADMQASFTSSSYNTQITGELAFTAILAALPNTADSIARIVQLNQIMHPVGVAVFRPTIKMIDDYCRSAGLEWSIQDNALQVLARNTPLAGQQIVINQDGGMLGSPSIDRKGEVKVTVLLQPGLHPGTPFHLDAKSIKGNFRVEAVEYVGNTSPGALPWYAHIVGSTVPYNRSA